MCNNKAVHTIPSEANLNQGGPFFHRAAAVCLSLVILASCATTNDSPIEITDEVRQSISVTRVINRIEQDGLDYQVTHSTIAQNTGGGFIPALVDVAVEKYRHARSEREAQPLEAKLADYGLDNRLNNALTNCLGAVDWLHVASVRLDKSKDEIDPGAVVQDGENAALIIDTHYYLDNDLKKLTIKTSANLYLLVAESQANRPEPIFRKKVFFAKSVPASTPEEAVKVWSDGEGQVFTQALSEGIDSVCSTLVDYLGRGPDKVGMVAP